MNLLLTTLLTIMGTPYKAVSKPMQEAWARYRRRKFCDALLMARVLGYPIMGASADAPPADTKVEALREQAAAKFKEANDLIEEAAKAAGTTVAALRSGDGELPAETLQKFDALMADGRKLHADYEQAAKNAGRWSGIKDAMDFYHGKATGNGPVPWHQVNVQTIERPKTLGETFIESAGYAEMVKSGVLHNEGVKFKTDGITILNDLRIKAENGDTEARKALKAATDIIQSTPSTGPGSSLVLPDYLAAILGLPQRPLTIRALFGSGQTTSDLISYAAQVAFNRAAAAVAQATTPSTGLKPQSSIAWERRTSPVETIATWMAATRQQLADAPQVQSLIDNQGRLMLQLEEEDQLISGGGVSPNLDGILHISGVQTLTVSGSANNLDSIRTAKRLIMTGLARKRADGVVMNPIDSEEFDLLKDQVGQYRGGNPVGNFTFGQGLWGLPRIESEAIPVGKVLVGAFKEGATVLERQPITVYTTDSHADFFVRNLIVVLFEERLGFPVFFPSAFVEISLDQTDWGT